jgi:hypothetical protein
VIELARTSAAVLVVVAGCLASSPPDSHVDEDGDGVLRSRDCNDRDPSVWQTLTVNVDLDHDGQGGAGRTTVCAGEVIPPGFAGAATDCDDRDGSRWQIVPAYVDADRDGYAGSTVATSGVCAGAGLPEGYEAAPMDCDDGDATAWQELGYVYRDADLDGHTVLHGGVVCSGVTLPPGYAMSASGVDCDDSDPDVFVTSSTYVDGDRDGVGDAATSICAGRTLPLGYAATTGDCAPDDPLRWQNLSYGYADRDGDGRTRYEGTYVCTGGSLPPGFGWTYGNDCDDADATAWTTVTGYADEDRDGAGVEPAIISCTDGARPTGQSAVGTDCAPADPLAWREVEYAYRDGDGDGVTIPAPATVCQGNATPAGYALAANGNDCDDSDADVHTRLYGYPDPDHDGFGAGSVAESFCTAGVLPETHVAPGTDCAPENGAAWRSVAYAHVDRDGDGYTRPEVGQRCLGDEPLASPYFTAAVGNDCDDDAPAVFRWVVLYRDEDGDGVGAPPRTIECRDGTLPPDSSTAGYDADDADPLVTADAELDDLFVVLF